MKINYARLHSVTFVPGLGTIRETLDNTQFPNVDMDFADGLLTVTASKTGTGKVTFLVPLPAIAIMTPSPL